VAFSPDGTRFVTGDTLERLTVWDAKAGRMMCSLENTDCVCSVAFSPNGNRVVYAAYGGIVGVWDIPGESRRQANGPIEATAAEVAYDVLRGTVPPGVLADFIEEHDCDLTGHQAKQLRWGNLFPAGYWAAFTASQ
jgi:WD40 repeat protein